MTSAWSVLEHPPFSAPVGVYFYDGGHNFDDQYRALELGEPLLADEALVIIDDTAFDRVAAANRAYTARLPQFERVLRLESPFNGEPRWWNGIEVYVFRRALTPSALRLRWRRFVHAATHGLQLKYRVARLLHRVGLRRR